MRLLALAGVLALAYSVPAAANPQHHHRHVARHHHHVSHRQAHSGLAHARVSERAIITCGRFGCTDSPRSGRAVGAIKTGSGFFAGNGLVAAARAHMGETARQLGLRRTEWCSAFLRALTHAGGVDDRAISWLRKPHVHAAVGTIAVMRHHVGVVAGFDGRGDPIIISGNHNRRVGEGVYPRRRVLAYVAPS